MAVFVDTRQCARAEDIVDAQWLSLTEYRRTHSTSSNDCDWLHEITSSDAISAGKISSKYVIKVYYKETEAASIIIVKDFEMKSVALLNLQKTLNSKYVRALILCHRDSSQVNSNVLDLLWTKCKLDVSFMRHHFDYREFRNESNCLEVIRDRLIEEYEMSKDYWIFDDRWNPIRLSSETRNFILRLSIDSKCLSVCCKDDVDESDFY
jgi:hypothetical protein